MSLLISQERHRAGVVKTLHREDCPMIQGAVMRVPDRQGFGKLKTGLKRYCTCLQGHLFDHR